MGMPGGWELFAIIVVIVLLFGGKKIPELAKGLGKGIKDFKGAMNEDDEKDAKEIAQKEIKEIDSKAQESATTTAQTEKKEA